MRAHVRQYAPRGLSPTWHVGHQYAMRLSSPCPHDRIARPAARARPPDPAVDLVRPSAAAVDRGAHQLGGRLERAPPLVLADRRAAAATARAAPPRAPRPATCSRSRRRATGRAAPRRTSATPSARAQPCEHRVDAAAAARGCPGRAGRARACAARARARSRGRASAGSPRSTSHGLPLRGSPRGRSVQRPVMRRCERTTTPPSKRSSRFLPCARHRFEHACRRSARRSRSTWARGMRRLGVDPLADERLQAQGRPVEAVTLGHAATVTSVEDCPSRCCLDSDPEYRRADQAHRRPPGHDPQVGAAVRRPAPRADRRAGSVATASSTSRASNG